MPANVTLERNGRVLHYIFQDPVTFAEIFAVEEQANIYYEAAAFKLHSYFDVREMRQVPQGFLQLRKTRGLSHPKAGITVVMGASTYVQVMAEMIMRLARNDRIRFFTPLQGNQAQEYLDQLVVAEDSVAKPGSASGMDVAQFEKLVR